jgi:calcineurin-like phosphoesterase family protein
MEDQDEQLIAQWNDKVKPGDIAFIIGDFSFYEAPRTSNILKSMNGQKTLVRGNHDHSKTISLTVGWSRVLHYHEQRIDGDRIVLSHFPFMSWHGQQKGAYHLHGHCHGNMRYPGELGSTRIMDVGIDNLSNVIGGYGPIEWSEIKELLSKRKPGHSDDGHRVRSETWS